LAYYTIFSLAPLLVIVIAIAGLVGGRDAVQGAAMTQVEGLVGAQGREFVQSMVATAGEQKSTGIIASVIGIVTLLFGALGAFGELQGSLNTIWEVKPKPAQGLMDTIKRYVLTRFFSFTVVLGVGFLLLASLVISAALSAFNEYMGSVLPFPPVILTLLNFVVSLGVITLLFAMIYKILPDADIAWKDVWLGALVTALLFNLGKYAIGLYLGQSNVGTTFGAAGSLAILLIWIYYSAQILFLGAEFTQVYANRFGSKIVPDEDAVKITEDERAHQGIPHKEADPSQTGATTTPLPGAAAGASASTAILNGERRPAAWEVLTRSQPPPVTTRRTRLQSTWPFEEKMPRKRNAGAIVSVALLSGLLALATSVGQIVRDVRSNKGG
jgi:membrane protein